MTRAIVLLIAGLALLQFQLSNAAAETDIDPKVNLVVELQAAVRDNNKDWLAAHLHYPVRYFGSGDGVKFEIITINNSD